MHGVLVVRGDGSMSLVSAKDACEKVGVTEHKVRFTSTVTLTDAGHVAATRERIAQLIKAGLSDTDYKVRDEKLYRFGIPLLS
jgi:hypothetical protein